MARSVSVASARLLNQLAAMAKNAAMESARTRRHIRPTRTIAESAVPRSVSCSSTALYLEKCLLTFNSAPMDRLAPLANASRLQLLSLIALTAAIVRVD